MSLTQKISMYLYWILIYFLYLYFNSSRSLTQVKAAIEEGSCLKSKLLTLLDIRYYCDTVTLDYDTVTLDWDSLQN